MAGSVWQAVMNGGSVAGGPASTYGSLQAEDKAMVTQKAAAKKKKKKKKNINLEAAHLHVITDLVQVGRPGS